MKTKMNMIKMALIITFLLQIAFLTPAFVSGFAPKYWPRKYLEKVGSDIIRMDESLRTYFENLELTASIPPDGKNKSVIIQLNNYTDIHIAVTPCSGPLLGVFFDSIKTRRSDEFNKDPPKRFYRNQGNGSPLKMYLDRLENDPNNGSSYFIGSNWLKGTNYSRVHLSIQNLSGDALLMVLYGRSNTSFNIRLAVKRKNHPFKPYEGYPVTPFHPEFDMCRTRINGSVYLKISWSGVFNHQPSVTKYCISVNRRQNLQQYCSLQVLKNQKEFVKRANLAYFCTNETKLELLISNGSEHLQKHDPRRNFYINIHAINATSGLSKSYHPIIVSRIPYCDERPISEIAVRFEHHAFPVHWPRDIVFDLSKTSGNISGYLVPCKRPHIMKSLFNLTVFEQKTFGEQGFETPIKSMIVPNAPIVDLRPITDALRSIPGKARIQLLPSNSGKTNSTNGTSIEDFLLRGEKAARLFFIKDASDSPFAVRPSVVDNSTGIIREADNETYPVEFYPICSGHYIVMNMTISPFTQRYQIVYLGVSNAKDIPQEEIEKRISTCEYDIDPLKNLFGDHHKTYTQEIVAGGVDSTTLEIMLPFRYTNRVAYNFFIQVYASTVMDRGNIYRSLFFSRMINICRIITTICYQFENYDCN